MEIRNRQEFRLSCRYPFFTLRSLAFRAMAVAAAVITNTQMATTGTAIHMAAKCCRAASPYCIKRAQLPAIVLLAMLQYRPMRIEHTGHFMRRLHYLSFV